MILGPDGATRDLTESGRVLVDIHLDGDGDTPARHRGAIWDGTTVTPLRVPVGMDSAFVSAMNERGDVAGHASGVDDNALYIWRDGEPVRLVGRGDGAIDSIEATALNERGDIAGTFEDAAGRSHAFLFRDGELIDLARAGVGSRAVALNDAGWVLLLDERERVFWSPVLFRDGERIALDISDVFDRGSADGVLNASGQVAYSKNRPSSQDFAYFWSAGTSVALENQTGERIGVRGMNDRGWVVGESSLAPDNLRRAALWRDGVLTDLGTNSFSNAFDVNERGEIVGVLDDPTGRRRPFFWADGVLTRLEHVEGFFTAEPRINDRGDIAAFFSTGEGDLRAALWRPDRCPPTDDAGPPPHDAGPAEDTAPPEPPPEPPPEDEGEL